MNGFVSRALILALVVACSAAATPAQSSKAPGGFRAAFLRQLEDAEKKLVALAEAVPQEKYSWRPARGVRSVSEVFMHVAGGNFFILQQMGVKAPADVGRDLEKTTDKAKVVETLKRSFEHVRQAALSTSEADLDKPVNLFGGNACS